MDEPSGHDPYEAARSSICKTTNERPCLGRARWIVPNVHTYRSVNDYAVQQVLVLSVHGPDCFLESPPPPSTTRCAHSFRSAARHAQAFLAVGR